MAGQNNDTTESSWTWIVLAGLIIILIGYVWMIYDPRRILLGASVAGVGAIVSVVGLVWRPFLEAPGEQ